MITMFKPLSNILRLREFLIQSAHDHNKQSQMHKETQINPFSIKLLKAHYETRCMRLELPHTDAPYQLQINSSFVFKLNILIRSSRIVKSIGLKV